MNILFFLTPKCDCVCIDENATLRQTMEKMEHAALSSVPMITGSGVYAGTLSEGDILWGIKEKFGMQLDMKEAEKIRISEFRRKRDYTPVSVRADIGSVLRLATTQNFVPVQDDEGKFIGIITRTDVFKYFLNKEKSPL